MELLRLLVCVVCFSAATAQVPSGYLVGIGKADITGPAGDVNLMGYANPGQTAQGIHIRLYARAFLFAESPTSRKRFVFVNADACMASQLVTIYVLKRLKALYGDLYTADNVAISGTHTHASSAGGMQYVLYTITSLGFVKDSFQAFVDGVVESISAAHNNLQPASVFFNTGELENANINRSPSAYMNNPAEERAKFKHNVDKTFQLLKVVDSDGRGVGSLSWYAVHCTSMNNSNRLLSGDNKGAAEIMMEEWGKEQASSQKTAPGFVAAFAQANVGDTSPNVQGAFCLDTGLPCQMTSSTCGGRSEQCQGKGPAWPNDKASTRIIGERQFKKAKELWESATEPVAGPIDFRHKFVDMTNVVVKATKWTRAGKTCAPAMGFSFAAGTTDGPGMFDFTQGDTSGNAFWRAVRNLIKRPSPELEACHAPKPILLDTSGRTPYPWQPSVVDLGLLRLGQVVIACVPGEFTTMAGRRIRAALAELVRPAWGEVQVVVAGLTGTYSSYVTTYEEYQIQRYEGASTIFGPHTFDAYLQELLAMAQAMVDGKPVPSTATPPDLLGKQWSFLPPVVFDSVPFGSRFGAVTHDAAGPYRAGDTVKVTFRTGCPRNNLRRGKSFMMVQRLSGPSTWTEVFNDYHWCTTYHWFRTFALSPHSYAEVTWTIPEGTAEGTYRLVHHGDYKEIWGRISEFRGVSSEFKVLAGRGR